MSKYSVTVYVDDFQPSELSPIGHAYYSIYDGVNKYYYGMYPDLSIDKLLVLSTSPVKGFVSREDGENRSPYVQQTYNITEAQFSTLYASSENLYNAPPDYDLALNEFACVTFTRTQLASIGIDIFEDEAIPIVAALELIRFMHGFYFGGSLSDAFDYSENEYRLPNGEHVELDGRALG